MTLSRRSFLTGLATLIAAPAIVRAESLMKLAPTEIIRATVEDHVFISSETRMDVLYGSMHVRPEWTAIVPEFPISLDEYSERILAPMVNRLAQNVADAVMRGESAAMIDPLRMYSANSPAAIRFGLLQTKKPWIESTNSHE